ncbi:DNA polymerase III subunit gamma/tau [Leptodesmis sp.]|uniref:DNA polymerase III subunit gamma/tau n=1 Tax=Leptodesmis sp. TaxID=3100501 RepID=UPI0040534619
MTYEPLHHKYRPQTFAELVGQEAIAATLTNAIEQQRIAPAYLFTGARGTGKTSSARILAKSLNCLSSPKPTATPCGRCEVCQAIARGSALDVIEIDAASNTGVDNIRELIERAQFAPVQCRYKVYVVDECHMLSAAAFNALLKTLEEPPDRVVFVLATTDPQRVLPTIISRCQRFDYRRIPLDAMVRHLQKIADLEGIAIKEEAITLVAQIAQGGLRDAESLLDQLSLLPTQIDVEQVWDLVGSVPERDLLGLLEAIAQNNPEAVLDHTRRLMDRGREPLIVLQNLASFYRDLLIAKTARDRNDLVALTPPTWQHLCTLAEHLNMATILAGQQHLRSAEVQLKHTTQPRLWLEVTLMGLLPSAIAPQPTAVAHPSSPIPRTPPSYPASPPPVSPSFTSSSPASQVAPSIPAEPFPGQEGAAKTSKQITSNTQPRQDEVVEELPVAAAIVNLEQTWQNIISAIQPFSTQVMVKQQCQLLGFDGEQVRLGVSTQPLFKMAQGKLPNIEAAFQKVFGRKVHITLEVAAPGSRASEPTQGQPSTRSIAPGAPPASGTPPVSQPQSQPPAGSPPPQVNLPQPPVVGQQGTSPPGPKPPETATTSADPEPLNDFSSPWEEDEVTRASKRLADFFAGQVVDLEDGTEPPTSIDKDLLNLEPAPDELDADEPDSPASWSSPSSGLEEEDDDDVPF